MNEQASVRRMPRWAPWLAAGVALALVGVGGGVLLRDAVNDEAADAVADAAATVEDLEGARIAIVGRFPNAEEVRFGKSFVHGDGEARAICGTVDIQQADDGFDGEERFVFVAGRLTLEETEGSDALTQIWKDVCEG